MPVEGATRLRSRVRARIVVGPLLGLDALPLAVHVRRRPRLGLAEHVGVAADDLRGQRGLDVGQVEHVGLRRELGVEDDLEQQVAELPRQIGRRTGLQGVVDLVRLLEQVLAQALVRLLAIPRTAVGCAQAIADGRHGPRTGGGQLRGDRSEVGRCLEVAQGQRTDRRDRRAPEPTDRVVRGVQPSEDGEGVTTARPVATRKRPRWVPHPRRHRATPFRHRRAAGRQER